MNTTSPRVVKELMQSYGIAPLKKFGQNFLVDGNIADKIADTALPGKGDFMALEVGPGLGGLTSRLLSRADCVAAYEIDAGLYRALNEIFEDEDKLSLFHQDFLKADIEKDIEPLAQGREIYVAANLPYYITSACIMKLLRVRLNLKRITVMIQKEVAQRICSAPGSREYGSISAAVAYFADAKMKFTVSPGCFYPRPDVHSAVLTLDVKPHDKERADEYLATVKGLFAKRRKTVKSNLRESFALSGEQAAAVLDRAGIDENARAEMLNINNFERICEEINNIKKNL